MKPTILKGELCTDAGKTSLIVLRLYIAGETVASMRAQANLTDLCEQQEPGRFTVEIVDILREPLRAMGEGILVTPTLVKLAPPPVIKIVGDLSDRATVFSAFGLADVRLK
jgi:circadian clock protein KaiB